jgi:uncharacterized protein (DUF58 family)
MTSPSDTGRAAIRMTWAGAVAFVAAGIGAIVWLAATEPSDEVRGPLLLGSLALAAVVVLDVVSARRGLPATVGATTSGTGIAGRAITYVLEVPVRRRPVTVALLDEPTGRDLGQATLTSTVPTPVDLMAPRRGIYRAQVFEARARGPLGLATARRRHRVPAPLAVGPAPVPHPMSLLPPPPESADDDGPRSPGEELVRGVRSYRRGDARRAVHWRATARHGTLMVREYEAGGTRTVRIVAAYATQGADAEAALGRASWAVTQCRRQGWQVLLVTCEPALPPPPTPRLRRSKAPVADLVLDAVAVRTVEGTVVDNGQLIRRLALAYPGVPAPDPAPIATRTISPEGDRWR